MNFSPFVPFLIRQNIKELMMTLVRIVNGLKLGACGTCIKVTLAQLENTKLCKIL